MARAFRIIVQPAMETAMAASASQTRSQRASLGWRAASAAAARAVSPMSRVPAPGTAVKEPARSMVVRMKRRSSAARSWRLWASIESLRDVFMGCKIGAVVTLVKNFM